MSENSEKSHFPSRSYIFTSLVLSDQQSKTQKSIIYSDVNEGKAANTQIWEIFLLINDLNYYQNCWYCCLIKKLNNTAGTKAISLAVKGLVALHRTCFSHKTLFNCCIFALIHYLYHHYTFCKSIKRYTAGVSPHHSIILLLLCNNATQQPVIYHLSSCILFDILQMHYQCFSFVPAS